MRHSRLATSIAASAFSISACVPLPNVVQTRPTINGTVSEGDKPVSGVEVFLGKYPGTNNPCDEVGERLSVSPENGNFFIAPKTESYVFQSLLNPPSRTLMTTAVCIRHPVRGILIGAMVVTFQDKPHFVRLNCELQRLPAPGSALGYSQINSPLGQAQACIATK